MNASETAIDGLVAQEANSLASCISRGQEPDSYADIVDKLRALVEKLPPERREFWANEIAVMGVTLIPKAKAKAKAEK